MIRFVAAICTIGLTGCSPQKMADVNRPPDSARLSQRIYFLVRAPLLRNVLEGHQLVDDPCHDTSLCTERFSSDGRSLERTGDAVPLVKGKYSVPGDRFCGTIDGQSRCKALYRAADGTYATMKFDGDWRDPVVVRITPLSGTPR